MDSATLYGDAEAAPGEAPSPRWADAAAATEASEAPSPRWADAAAATEASEAEGAKQERRRHALAAAAAARAGGGDQPPAVPSNMCAICLNQMTDDTRTVVEECYHSFCRECIATWCDRQASGDKAAAANAAPGCPLCREPIVALLHEIRGDDEYLRSRPDDIRQAAERAAAARRQRNRDASRRLDAEVRDPFGPRALARRRQIYARRQYSHRAYQRAGRCLPAAAPASLRLRPGAAATELAPWLRRELIALLGIEDVETVVWFVLGLCERGGIPAPPAAAPPPGQPLRQGSWLGAPPCEAQLKPFLGERTAHFLHELYAFALSPVPLELYDRVLCYPDQQPQPQPQPQPQAVPRQPEPRQPGTAAARDSGPAQAPVAERAAEETEAEQRRRERRQRRAERQKRRAQREERRERKRQRRSAAAQRLSQAASAVPSAENAPVAAAAAAVPSKVLDIQQLRRRRLAYLGQLEAEQSPAEASSAASAVAPAARAPPQPSPRPAIEGGGVVGIPPAVAAGRDGAELEAQLRAACIQSMWQRMRLDSPRRSGGRRDG